MNVQSQPMRTTLPHVCRAELALAQQGQTFNEWCEQYHITDPVVLRKADELDGYTGEGKACASRS